MKRTALLLALLMLCAGAASSETAFDKHRVYYEIFVGGFYDSDGDGMGDLNGVRQKLDILGPEGLGVGGVWLMPVMPSPSYHKYDVTDYRAIDPAYGTMADFDALLAACGERDIALLVDLVLNHSSSEHPWFLSAARSLSIPPCGQEPCADAALCPAHNPYCGYYHFSKTPASGWHSLPNGWYYQGAFGPHMPDLNLSNEALRAEILSVADFWLSKGVAGFRLDAVIEYENRNTAQNVAFLSWFRTELAARHPSAYLVGEAWTDAATIARYYPSGVDSFFNFPFSQNDGAIVAAVRGGKGRALAEKAAAWQATIRAANPDAIDAPFLSNHDNARSAGFLARKLPLMKMCAAVYLLLPGNPFIYYGEEIGMTGSGRDENKRQPMVWSAGDSTGIPNPPADADQTQSLAAGVAEQIGDPDSLWRFYQQTLRVRARHPEIAYGAVTALPIGESGLCALRFDGGGTVVVLHNVGKTEIRLPLAEGPLAGLTVMDCLRADAALPTFDKTTLTMPPMTTAVLR